jgi:hypothetical protein
MTAPIELLAQTRNNGRERLTVRWVESDGFHRLEIGIERCDGGQWRRSHFVSTDPGEVFRLHDAIGMATWLARQVQR